MSHKHGFRVPQGATPEIISMFQQIARWTEDPTQVLVHEQHVEPDKPRLGLLVFADGTDWNPGSGAGLYVYKAAGWTFIV